MSDSEDKVPSPAEKRRSKKESQMEKNKKLFIIQMHERAHKESRDSAIIAKGGYTKTDSGTVVGADTLAGKMGMLRQRVRASRAAAQMKAKGIFKNR